MKTVVASHPKHNHPGVFVVFFSDGDVMEYDSLTGCWFNKFRTHKVMS